MIDKDGKIGGKINLIDLIIIVVILAAVAFTAYRFLSAKEEEAPDTEPVLIEFTSTEVNDFTVEQLEIGAPVIDVSPEKDLGTLADFETEDAVSYTVTDSGQVVVINIPFSQTVELTIESTGILDGNGVIIDGLRYGIGHSTVIYVGDCKLWGKISGIDPA